MESRKFEVNEKKTTLTGSLTKTEFITIGHFLGCEILKIRSTNLVTKNTTTFVKLERTIENEYSSDTISAALSFDEVESLINSLKAFKESVMTTTPNVYTEVNYTTNDFKAGCFYSKQEWTTFLKLSQHNDDSYVFVKEDDFDKLIGLLENTKQN